MPIDYYAETTRIIDALASEGLSAEGRPLRDVMRDGSTATEILMGVRWHLQEIARANTIISLNTMRAVRELIAELDKVLS